MAQAKKVAKLGLKRKEGYLYFVDRAGDVSMVAMNRGGKRKAKSSKKKKGKKRR